MLRFVQRLAGKFGLMEKVLASAVLFSSGCEQASSDKKVVGISGNQDVVSLTWKERSVAYTLDLGGRFANFIDYADEIWNIDWEGVVDNKNPPKHGSYFDDALVEIGLQNPEPKTYSDSQANLFSRLLVQSSVLENCALTLGNDGDGSPVPGGIKLSVMRPYDDAFKHNIICLGYGDDAKFVGRAYIDEGNRFVDRVCTDGNYFLGVAMDVWVGQHFMFYTVGGSFVLKNDGIKGSDLEILYDIYHGMDRDEKRFHDIKEAIGNAGFSMHRILLHEIGHAVGLNHDNAEKTYHVMHDSFFIPKYDVLRFSEENLAKLEETLGIY
jgi:hypothetical protein